jgi:hypothetical protein
MAYSYWSPFASQELFLHQWAVMRRNAVTVTRLLGRFDSLWLGLIAVLGALWAGHGWREKLNRERWRWSLVLVACLAMIHLPVRVERVDQRYFFAAWPFLFAAAIGLALFLTMSLANRSPVLRWLTLAVVTASFARPMIEGAPMALLGIGDPASLVAQDLAQRMKQAGLRGPIAGSATLAGVKTGLYVASLLDAPWHGDELRPGFESIRKSSCRFYIAPRGSAVAGELKGAAGFRDLDPVLLPEADLRETHPLQVFEVLPR